MNLEHICCDEFLQTDRVSITDLSRLMHTYGSVIAGIKGWKELGVRRRGFSDEYRSKHFELLGVLGAIVHVRFRYCLSVATYELIKSEFQEMISWSLTSGHIIDCDFIEKRCENHLKVWDLINRFREEIESGS